SPTLECLDQLMSRLATASMAQLLREPVRICLGFKPRNTNDGKERIIPLAVVPPVGLMPFCLRTLCQRKPPRARHFAIRNALTPVPPRIAPVRSTLVSIRCHKAGKLTIGHRVFAHPHPDAWHLSKGIQASRITVSRGKKHIACLRLWHPA